MKTIKQLKFMKTTRRLSHFSQICLAVLIFSSMILPSYAFDLNSLSSVGKPTVAYSIRKLSSTYTGPALTVRSGDNNAIVDVYFDVDNIVSLNSPVSADGGGVATSKTLKTWIGANTAFVTKWYDQSGNGRDAVTAGTRCKAMAGTLTTQLTSANATLFTPIAVKKYTISVVNAVNNQDSIVIATIPTASVGVTGGSAGTAVITGYPSSGTGVTAKWQLLNNVLEGAGVPEGTMIMSSSQLLTSVTGNVKVKLSKPVSLAAGATITMYDNVGIIYQPGNVIVSLDGYYVGTIKSIGDDGKSIVFTNNSIIGGTFATNKWGLSTEPILVKQGVLQTTANGMTAIKFVNGAVAGNSLSIPNFTNDGTTGANYNLQNVNNMSLFIAAQMTGNAANTNFLFGSSAPTAATPGKLQVFFNAGANSLGLYSTQAGVSSSFATGTQILARYKLLDDSLTLFAPYGVPSTVNKGKKGIFTSTATTPVTTPLDTAHVQIFGHSSNVYRCFEGLASELVFWGSTDKTTGAMLDADAALLQTSQKVYFVDKFTFTPTALNNTNSDLLVKVYPTISNGIFNIEGDCVDANYVVVNLMGQVIQSGKIYKTTQVIDLTKNASGAYFVKLSLNNSIIVKKIVKL